MDFLNDTSDDKFIFFYGGPFSQWARSVFKIDGVKYTCAEQYMMAMKADFFGDEESRKAIMKSHDPMTMKAIGRKVKDFDPDKWAKVAEGFVYRANMAKFSEPSLKKFILSTGDREIVEASPTDTIWGIGLAEYDPKCYDKTQWRGTNLLGVVLMKVREDLRNENGKNSNGNQ